MATTEPTGLKRPRSPDTTDTSDNHKKQKKVHFDSSVPVSDTPVNPEYMNPRKAIRIPIKTDALSIADRLLESERQSRNAYMAAAAHMSDLARLYRQEDDTPTRPPPTTPPGTPA